MLDHIQIEVSDIEKSKEFYIEALEPLGYKLILEFEGWLGFGCDDEIDFCINSGKKVTPGVHVAFRSDNREKVKAFYNSALNAGGKDNGKPGIREHYHPNYYGAFVIDPDGHNIEAVCHKPE